MNKTAKHSWLYRLRQRAKDDSGAEMVEYIMMIVFVMVAMAGMFSALNKALAGSIQVSIAALTGQTNQAVAEMKQTRDDAADAIKNANTYRTTIVNEPDGKA